MKLKAAQLKHLPHGVSKDGKPYDARYPDGKYGLYFNVKPSGARSFVQRLVIDGRRRTFGLGPWPVVSLAEARDEAIDNVRLRRKGINPIAQRGRTRAVPTFAAAADSYIALQSQTWKAGSRNAENWRSSLAHAGALADRPIDAVTTDDVIGVVGGAGAGRQGTDREGATAAHAGDLRLGAGAGLPHRQSR